MTTAALRQYVYLSENALPAMPSLNELANIRKGLRRKAVPNFDALPDEYECAGLGAFKKTKLQGEIAFEWQLPGSESRGFTFDELCRDSQREIDRLEFGWMIASFAALDGNRYLSRLRPITMQDRHQDLYWREHKKQAKHYLAIVTEWRHWAVVSAGHMKLG
jgi:hypothetical protein